MRLQFWFNIRMGLLIQLALCAVANAVCAAPAIKSGEALKLKIKSDALGDSTAFVRSDSLRINFGDGHAYLVSQAPSWRVYLYNSKTKRGLEMPYEKWLTHQVYWNFAGNDEWLWNEAILKVCDVKCLGLDATRYRLARKLDDGRIVLKTTGSRGHFILANKPAISPQISNVIEKAFCLPKCLGLPLEMVTYGSDKDAKIEGFNRATGADDHVYKVLEATEVACPQGYFASPKGFSPQKKEADVVFDAAHKKSVEEFMDMLN
jgi:hypothetical protein